MRKFVAQPAHTSSLNRCDFSNITRVLELFFLMASSPQCTISFDDNYHGVFFAGQTITGTVDIDLPKTKKVKGTFLTADGKTILCDV